MPALTFSDVPPFVPDSASRDHANPYPRPSLPRPHRHPPDAVYTHARSDTTPSFPYSDRVYSPSFPSQITSLPPSNAMFSYFAHPHPSSNWHLHLPPPQPNPYPPSQPPQLVHKVWILDCRSCGTFLTNRGMKAVLLLRPNVSLFSTDALPVNCSAYSTNPDALRPPPCRPSTSAHAPRTCECLTQTLCCHTCGSAVGYMIVIPCSRCTSSISATNRATNGHRFVFHSSEIIASERHHIPDEPGVLPVEYPTPRPPSSPPPLAPAYPTVFHSTEALGHRGPGNAVPSQAFQPPQALSPSPSSDYLSSPQVESPDLAPFSAHSSPDLHNSVPPTSPRRSPYPVLQTPIPRHPLSQTPSETRASTPEPPPRKLMAGDVLYWHHLTKHGEIPEVEEDPRARIPSQANALKFFGR